MKAIRKLEDQTVVVTGASSGIGRVAARMLARAGAAVVLVARRREALESLAAEIRAEGGRAIAAPADVSREAEVQAAADLAVATYGRIDTWVNDAGIFAQGCVDDMTYDEYRRVLDVDVMGYIIGAKCALAQMRKQGSGVIIFVSSIVGKRGAPYASAYSTAKAALDGFAESLRAELWDTDIHVATIYPPSIDTPIYENALGKFGTRPEPAPPVRRPEVPAKLIAHLAERPHPNKFFGWFRYIYIGLHELSPLLSDWFLHHTRDLTRGDTPAGPSNMYEPSHAPAVERVGLAKRGIAGFQLTKLMRVLPLETTIAAALLSIATFYAARAGVRALR